MEITPLENSCWSGDDGLYYKIYGLGEHSKTITGIIRKCNQDSSFEMDTPNPDFQYRFTVITVNHSCKVVSELFINSQTLFNLSVSNLKIVVSIDEVPQLALTRIEYPKQ